MTEAEGPGWKFERELWRRGAGTVIGVDEAGRGCLAGPVTAAAVVLPFRTSWPYRDSKTLSSEERERLARHLQDNAVAAATGWASAREIDRHGILAATHRAAGRALAALGFPLAGAALLTDYLKLEFDGPVLAPPRADRLSFQAAAAGILAKTARDRYMRELAEREPGYGFERHKGYGTKAHLQAIRLLGPGAEHRLSFAPLRGYAADAPGTVTIPS